MLQSIQTTSSWRWSQFTSSKPANATLLRVKINSCLLSTTWDCQLRVDIGEQTVTTTLWPDLILCLTETRQVVLIELTVLWEKNIEVTSERKLEKYQELVEQCKSNKWWTACYPIEIGCRGFAGRSLCRILSPLGMIGEKRERPPDCFQNWLKKSQDGYGLKAQIHLAQERLKSINIFDGKIERVWKRENEEGGK